MKDTIYIPFILSQPLCFGNHLMEMLPKLKELKTPEGISLVEIRIDDNQLIRHLLDRLEKINGDSLDPAVYFTVPQYQLEISFETDEPIHCKTLPWLEEQIDSIFP